MRLKKILKDTPKTKKFLDSLPKIYLIGCWADYGYIWYPCTNKNKDGIPLVYQYYDANGTTSEYHLVPIDHTTTGRVLGWTTSEAAASKMANSLSRYAEGMIDEMCVVGQVWYDGFTNSLNGELIARPDIKFSAKTCDGIQKAFKKAVDAAPGTIEETQFGPIKRVIPTVHEMKK